MRLDDRTSNTEEETHQTAEKSTHQRPPARPDALRPEHARREIVARQGIVARGQGGGSGAHGAAGVDSPATSWISRAESDTPGILDPLKVSDVDS